MTPKIAAFLRRTDVATPCLVLDVDHAEAKYRAIAAALPGARVYYAVKANPAAPLLERLVAAGASFDAASLPEIEQCLAAGATPAAISFGSTIKKATAIAGAYARGVRLFAFDSAEELAKLAEHAPGARVYCRLMVGNAGADWPLSKKFGTDADDAVSLMLQARALGLDPHGVSFHVGSQQNGARAYEDAIDLAATVLARLRAEGVPLRMLNLGGGFPVAYQEPVAGVPAFASAIEAALTRAFGPDRPEILLEPGRAIVADAGVVASEVVLVSRRAVDPRRWVYLDIGRFGGLAETEGEAIRYRVTAPGAAGPLVPAVLAGPSCDGVDVLYERTPYLLPGALRAGDRVLIDAAGAYVTTYASQGFNGFAPPTEYFV